MENIASLQAIDACLTRRSVQVRNQMHALLRPNVNVCASLSIEARRGKLTHRCSSL